MKKLLLTLGTAASVVAPLATVVACGEETKKEAEVKLEVSYDSDTKTLSITGVQSLRNDEDPTDTEAMNAMLEEVATKIDVAEYEEATSIEMEVLGLRDDDDTPLKDIKATVKIVDIKHELTGTATTLKEFMDLAWEANTEDGFSKEAESISTIITAVFLQSRDDEIAAIKKSVSELNLTSTFEDGSSFTASTTATDAATALTAFGFVDTEYAKLTKIFDDLPEGNIWELKSITLDINATKDILEVNFGQFTDATEIADLAITFTPSSTTDPVA